MRRKIICFTGSGLSLLALGYLIIFLAPDSFFKIFMFFLFLSLAVFGLIYGLTARLKTSLWLMLITDFFFFTRLQNLSLFVFFLFLLLSWSVLKFLIDKNP